MYRQMSDVTHSRSDIISENANFLAIAAINFMTMSEDIRKYIGRGLSYDDVT